MYLFLNFYFINGFIYALLVVLNTFMISYKASFHNNSVERFLNYRNRIAFAIAPAVTLSEQVATGVNYERKFFIWTNCPKAATLEFTAAGGLIVEKYAFFVGL